MEEGGRSWTETKHVTYKSKGLEGHVFGWRCEEATLSARMTPIMKSSKGKATCRSEKWQE